MCMCTASFGRETKAKTDDKKKKKHQLKKTRHCNIIIPVTAGSSGNPPLLESRIRGVVQQDDAPVTDNNSFRTVF